MWDSTNWQPSCKWHHDRVKQQLEVMWRQGSINKEDLKLDSAVARRLTNKLNNAPPGGA
jgi:hypothetical protein